MDQHYSISEVATKLNLSQKTIRRHIASGELLSYKIGNVYRIKEDDIANFLDKNRVNDKGQYNIFPEIKISNKNKKGEDVNWAQISGLWKSKKKNKINYVDLFSGAGGLSYGFQLAGLNGIYGLDNYKPAVDTYEYNFSHPIFDGDITSKDVKKEFCKKVKDRLNGDKLHIIAGGFPCQGFSMAGNRIVADPRNSLYLDMLDIVKSLKPDFVVMENVVGLRSMLKGGVERKIISDLADLNYITNVTTLCAADYEVPQMRKRVIFIANNLGIQNYHPKPLLSEEEYKTTKDAIEDLIIKKDDESFNHVATKHSKDMIKRIKKVPEGSSLYENYSDSWKKCPWDRASCTIKENHGGVNLHPRLPRVLTAREMARIQSFPDKFIFKGPKSKQMVQIGNAVPPLLGKAIGLSIVESYKYSKMEELSFQNDFISIKDVINKKIPDEKGCYIIRILEGVKMHSKYRFEENSLSNRIIYVGLGGEEGTEATIQSRFSKHKQDSGTPSSSFRRAISAVLMEEKQLNPFLNNSDKIDHNKKERTIITDFIKQNCECRFITLKDNKNFHTAEKLEKHLVELLKPTLNCKDNHDKEHNKYFDAIIKLRKEQKDNIDILSKSFKKDAKK